MVKASFKRLLVRSPITGITEPDKMAGCEYSLFSQLLKARASVITLEKTDINFHWERNVIIYTSLFSLHLFNCDNLRVYIGILYLGTHYTMLIRIIVRKSSYDLCDSVSTSYSLNTRTVMLVLKIIILRYFTCAISKGMQLHPPKWTLTFIHVAILITYSDLN